MSLKTNLFRFIFISVLGVLLHFTYEWSGDNAVVGLFSAVNESTWEHLKLLFFPFLLLTILEVLLRGNMLPEQFLPARVLGILAGMGGIVVGFYTLRGVLGRNYDALNTKCNCTNTIYRNSRKFCCCSIRTAGTNTDSQICLF